MKSCGCSFCDNPIRPFHQRDKNPWAAKFGGPLIQIYFLLLKLSGEKRNVLRYNSVHRNLAETFRGSMAGVL